MKNCTVQINDDSIFEPEEEFQVHLGSPQGDHWTGAMVGIRDVATVTITNDEDGKERLNAFTLRQHKAQIEVYPVHIVGILDSPILVTTLDYSRKHDVGRTYFQAQNKGCV